MSRIHPLHTLYRRLFNAYGPQNWWPAETPFEVMVGAILTQNTAWTNVEKAINNLKLANVLSAEKLGKMDEDRLAQLIRPSGYFNIKAKRLKHYLDWYRQQGEFEKLSQWQTDELRTALLAVNGIGPETADDILLYAFERPVFVIDTYTRRLLIKLGLIKGDEDYEALRHLFESTLKRNVKKYNEYHALIVRHAKQVCNGEKKCLHCKIEVPFKAK